MERDKDIINVITDGPRSVKILCAICTAVLIMSFILGLALPNSAAVSRQLDVMRHKDKTYTEVKKDNEAAIKALDRATKRLEDKKNELEDSDKSQKSLDKITESNNALKAEKESLSAEIAKKQSELNSLNISVTDKTKKTVTWSSGRYTVGENIAAGRYNVTGSGSISIGNSGKSIANKHLKSDGEVFNLSNGDVIQIDGNAKFVPE